MEDNKAKNKDKSHKREDNLVLRINNSYKTIRYNDECEKTFGYLRDEILNKSIFEELVPDKYLDQWNKILKSITENPNITEFKLPLLTKNGHEIMISWISFPIKNKDRQVEDIDFVGSFISSWNDSRDSVPIKFNKYEKNTSVKWKEVNQGQSKDIKETKFKDPYLSDILKKYNFLKDENAYLKKYIRKVKNKYSEEDHFKKNIFGKTIYKISDVVGGKKRREEFKSIKNELDAREEYLEDLHSLIKEDKKSIIQQRNDLIKWREKLELLESDIESRKKWVENKEESLKKYYSFDNKESLKSGETFEERYSSNMITEIEDSAAIVQRGIFKSVNESFANLLGYNVEEIVDKSLFDFVVSDGFSNIENYYLHRLKGDKVSSIDTMFLTKDNIKIDVQVSTKPTFFDGEKAEIFIIKQDGVEKSKNKKNKESVSSNNTNVSQKEMKNIFSRLKDRREDKKSKNNEK